MLSKFFEKYFPPPIFLNPQHSGISFSDTHVKIVVFDGTKNKPHFKVLIENLEEGVIVSGSIVKQDVLIEYLSKMRKQINTPFTFFTIPDELIYLFSANIPYSSGMNVYEAVSFVLEENVPISASESVFDFVPLQISKDAEDRHTLSVLVSVCSVNDISKFTDVLKASNFDPLGCVNESSAISKSVIKTGDKSTSCIINARAHRLSINLVRNGNVIFSSVSPITNSDYGAQVLEEYEKFFEYCLKYQSVNKDPISLIFVAGEFEYAKIVVEAISKSSYYAHNVKLSNVWSNVLSIKDNVPNISYEDSLNIAGPIGAVLTPIY